MAIDKSVIGKSGKPFTMPIEWSKVREFARAIRDPNPVYFDPELAKKECGGIPVPPTFLQVAAFWQDAESDADGAFRSAPDPAWRAGVRVVQADLRR